MWTSYMAKFSVLVAIFLNILKNMEIYVEIMLEEIQWKSSIGFRCGLASQFQDIIAQLW